LGLISRRRIHRSGTRFNVRGLDDYGHVANFVETEQIVQTKERFMSYVMVRGSVPIFWEQKGLIEDVVITKNSELTHRSFNKHFEDLV
jgi:synaptojanin